MSRIAVLLSFVVITGCEDDPTESDPSLVLDPADSVPSVPEDTGTAEPECGPTELCTRSTQECGYNVTVDVCASWYDDASNCADMEAYTTCNCDCIDEDTCDAYYSCGELCFADHC